MTPAAFKTLFTEFAGVSDLVIQYNLDLAGDMTAQPAPMPDRVFEQAIGLTAADLIFRNGEYGTSEANSHASAQAAGITKIQDGDTQIAYATPSSGGSTKSGAVALSQYAERYNVLVAPYRTWGFCA